MEVLFRCISIRSADPKPGKENEIQHIIHAEEKHVMIYSLWKKDQLQIAISTKKNKNHPQDQPPHTHLKSP